MIRFDNSYARLPDLFFERIRPTPVKSPRLVEWNFRLADELDLGLTGASEDQLARWFSGNELLPGAEPIALAYAGHQFGHFVPQLGDGRAILLGEALGAGGRRSDIALKGSGRTKFSRGGDGRAALGPVIREYVLSEAMMALGIPTTRSLAIITTGEPVFRERMLPGAILTRIAQSHIRIGTFEYFAARGDLESVKRLAEYVRQRHYPEARDIQEMFARIITAQAELIARWMHVGFIHGVMNTDNMAVSGETIDYGPCAFVDEYDPGAVFSSIDTHGRYAFGNQPQIALWNLESLGGVLVPLLSEKSVVEELEQFEEQFRAHWIAGMSRKMGVEDLDLIQEFLELMAKSRADFTLSFRYLCDAANGDAKNLRALFSNGEELDAWLVKWRSRLTNDAVRDMRRFNPAFIPRNHRVEKAISAAVDNGDFSEMRKLNAILQKPFDDQPENFEYMRPPSPDERVLKTFCGT